MSQAPKALYLQCAALFLVFIHLSVKKIWNEPGFVSITLGQKYISKLPKGHFYLSSTYKVPDIESFYLHYLVFE